MDQSCFMMKGKAGVQTKKKRSTTGGWKRNKGRGRGSELLIWPGLTPIVGRMLQCLKRGEKKVRGKEKT